MTDEQKQELRARLSELERASSELCGRAMMTAGANPAITRYTDAEWALGEFIDELIRGDGE